MTTIINPFRIIDLSPERRGMAAFLSLKEDRHCMYALLEVDVTTAREIIDNIKVRTGEQLSFTGYLIFCLACTVSEDRSVQAYKKGNKQLLIFENVDVGCMIEKAKGDRRILTGHVIRAANNKTFHDIHEEIRSVQSSQAPSDSEKLTWFRSALLLPWPLSQFFKSLFRFMLKRDPTIVTSMAGTVGISSVGMFGKGHAGWGIANGSHALDLVVGGTTQKLAEVDGKLEARQILNLTIIFDHDVIDGAPAARFARRLVDLIESGYGLDELRSQTAAMQSQPV